MNIFQRAKEAYRNVFYSVKTNSGSPRVAALLPGDRAITITPETALTYSAIWRAVQVRSNFFSRLPFSLVDVETGEKYANYNKHPLYKLFNISPNGRTSATDFLIYLQQSADLRDNGYAFIQRDGRGNVLSLHELMPERVKIVSANNEYGYEYVVTDYYGDSMSGKVHPMNMFHIRGEYSLDNIQGWCPITYARVSISLGISAEAFGESLFANGANPGGVFQIPGALPEAEYEKVVRQLQERYAGLANASRPMLLTNGAQWIATSVSPENAQFLGTRQHQVTDVARWYSINPAKLFGAPSASIEEQDMEFIGDVVVPIIKRYENQIRLKLMTPQEQELFRPEFDEDGLQRGRLTDVTNSLREQFYMSAVTVNEVREAFGRAPIPGGDIYQSQMNMNIHDADYQKPDVPPPDEDTPDEVEDETEDDTEEDEPEARKIIRRWTSDTAGRLLQRDLDRLSRSIAKAEDAEALIREHYEKQGDSIVLSLSAIPGVSGEAYISHQRGKLLGVLRDEGIEGVQRLLASWSDGTRKAELVSILLGESNEN